MGESGGIIYGVLGDLEIRRDGLLLPLPGGRDLVTLAVFLMNANRQLSRSELKWLVWGSYDVADAQLNKRVHEVRKILKQVGRRDDLKMYSGLGYKLLAVPEDLDTLAFEQLIRSADEAEAAGDGPETAELLKRALRLWRGPAPLANVPPEKFAGHIRQWRQRHCDVAARLFELELRSGNHQLILAELRTVADLYPADQKLREQLMIAEYLCGHKAEIGDAYQRYLETLAHDGTGPDTLLRALHFAVGMGDDAAIARALTSLDQRAGRPALGSREAARPRQLPPAPELVGRMGLAAEVTWLLDADPGPAFPVLVIVGPGGVGKTALAVRAAHEVANRYPDGQLYVELHGTTGVRMDTGQILAQFLRALGASRIPKTSAERLADFRTMLAGRRVLILLDDAADSAQVTELLPGSAGCAVLVTARHRMPDIGANHHHVAALEPLEAPVAALLFQQLAGAGGIELEPDHVAIDEVVALCAGLPLALCIAAALRVHRASRSTAELASRLAQQGLEGFRYGTMSVAVTIGAGYERLEPLAARLFLGFGLLPLTQFGLWTALAMLDCGVDDSDEALSELEASFMLESVKPTPRYRFHDLTREYAHVRALKEYPGDQVADVARVYRALLTLTRRAHANLHGGDYEVVHSRIDDWDPPSGQLHPGDGDARDWFELERLNIRAAIGHCAELGLTELCWDLAVSAHEFYGLRGYFDDWQATHAIALRACQDAGDTYGEGVVLTCMNQPMLVASRRADSVRAIEDLEHAVDLLTKSGNRHGLAIALRTLGNALRRRGHVTRPLQMFNEALDGYAVSGDILGQAQTLRYIGTAHLSVGHLQQALEVLAQAEAIAVQLGSDAVIGQARYWLGQAHLAANDIDKARGELNAVFEEFGLSNGIGRAYALHGLGDLARHSAQYDQAGRYLAEAVQSARDNADAGLEGRVWLSIAELRRDVHDDQGRLDALRTAASTFETGGAAHLEVRALAALAGALAGHGDAEAAQEMRARVEAIYDSAEVPSADRIALRL